MAPSRVLPRQDFRATIVDLDQYDAQQAMEDLGIHRHVSLPLAGPAANVAAPLPEANPRKYGKDAVRKADRAGDQAARWGSLYQPTLEEQERDDGLGGGQLHRLGNFFQPNAHWIGMKPNHHTVHDAHKKAGIGRGRGMSVGGKPRARSLSPAPRGRGRGMPLAPLAAPTVSGQFDLGKRPSIKPAQHIRRMDTSITTRQVRPRISGRFNEDSAVLPSEVRARMREVNPADVQHWNQSIGARLVSNRAQDAEFFRRGFLANQKAVNEAAAAAQASRNVQPSPMSKATDDPAKAAPQQATVAPSKHTPATNTLLKDITVTSMNGRTAVESAVSKEGVKGAGAVPEPASKLAVIKEGPAPSESTPKLVDKSAKNGVNVLDQARKSLGDAIKDPIMKSKWATTESIPTQTSKSAPGGRDRPRASYDIPVRKSKWAPIDPIVLDSLGPSSSAEEEAQSPPTLKVDVTPPPVQENIKSQPVTSSQKEVLSPTEPNTGLEGSRWAITCDRVESPASRSSSKARKNAPPARKKHQPSPSPLAEAFKQENIVPQAGLVRSKWAPPKGNEAGLDTAQPSSKTEPNTSGNLPTVADSDSNDNSAASIMATDASNDDWVTPPPAINPFEATDSPLHLDDLLRASSARRRMITAALGKREFQPAGARSRSISSKEYEKKIEELNSEISFFEVADPEKTKELQLLSDEVSKLEQQLQQAYHARSVVSKDLKTIKENIGRLYEEVKRAEELKSAALAAEERTRAQERKRQEAERRAAEQAAEDARRAEEQKKIEEMKAKQKAEATAQESERQEREKLRLQKEREERRIREEKEAEERRIQEEEAAKRAAAEERAVYIAELENKPWRSLTAEERRILNEAMGEPLATKASVQSPVTQQSPQHAQPVAPVAPAVDNNAEFQRLNDIAGQLDEPGNVGDDYVVTVNLPEAFGKPTVTMNLPMTSHNPQSAIRDAIRGAIGADYYITLSGLKSFRAWQREVLSRFYSRKIRSDIDL